MKTLSILLSLLASINAFAFTYHGMELQDVLESEAVSVLYEGKTTIPQELFSTTQPFVDFDYESCSAALYEVVFLDMDGEEYRAVFSNEDQCDGGNTYGFIMNVSTKVSVAQIHDGEIQLNK